MAAVLLQEISQDEHERARALSRKKYRMDITSGILTAELRGELRERDKWHDVVAEKEAEIERLRLENAKLKALGDKH